MLRAEKSPSGVEHERQAPEGIGKYDVLFQVLQVLGHIVSIKADNSMVAYGPIERQ